MSKHSKHGTADNGDTHAGGDKLGKHEKGFSSKENASDMLDRLAEERGRNNPKPMGDLSSMEDGSGL